MKRITPSTQCWLVGHRILFLSCVVVLFFLFFPFEPTLTPPPISVWLPVRKFILRVGGGWVVARGVSH